MLWFPKKTNQNLSFPQDQRYAPKRAKPNNRGFGLFPKRFLMKPFANMIVTLRGTTLMLWFRKKTNQNLSFPQDQRYAP